MNTTENIQAFYADGREQGRLASGIGPLEFARSREIIARHLPPASAVVYDIGGGPGAYSFWLAGLGYQVHLLDLSLLHIRQAQERDHTGTVRLAGIHVGDARMLPFDDESADAVILHGPLYHLTNLTDRLLALSEARRVLRPGGVLLAFAISSAASTIVGLLREWVWDADYRRMCVEELTTGLHDRPSNWPGLLMDGFFHSPAQLRKEIEAAGFDHEKTLGIQGPAWMPPNFAEDWKNDDRRRAMLEIAKAAETEPSLSPHMMAVGRKKQVA